MTRPFLLFCALVFGAPSVLIAEGPDTPEDRILFPGSVRMAFVGPFGGIDYAMHTGSFSTSDQGLLCCTFEKGHGIGPAAGIKAFLPILGLLDFSPRILYEDFAGTFTETQQQYPIRTGGSVTYVTLENTLDADLHAVTVDVFASYTFGLTGLYIAAGPSASFLIGARYVQNEKILGPPGAQYLDGSTSKALFDGDFGITKTAFFTLRGGIGWRLRLTETVYLNPEALYVFPLTAVSKSGDWKVAALQGTIGILFTI